MVFQQRNVLILLKLAHVCQDLSLFNYPVKKFRIVSERLEAIRSATTLLSHYATNRGLMRSCRHSIPFGLEPTRNPAALGRRWPTLDLNRLFITEVGDRGKARHAPASIGS